jgi:predicted enzyme related to lactoylglutathione lyase
MVLKRGNVQHVEINVSNFERSKSFYQDFLEWLGYKQIVSGNDYAG